MGKAFHFIRKIHGFEKMWLKMYKKPITKNSGIYILARNGEEGLKYAYVGQSKHVLQRLAEHMLRYDQHIDKSIRDHKLYSKNKPYGWRLVGVVPCSVEELDEKEKEYTLKYGNGGYQLRNKTGGGQGEGKGGINDNQGGLGYRKGVTYGYEKCRKDVQEFMKYLFFMENEDTALCERKCKEFAEWLQDKKPE